MRSVVVCLLLLCCLSTPIMSVEFGAAATSESGISGLSGGSLGFAQRFRGELSLTLGSAGDTHAAVRGGYLYALGDTLPVDWDNFWLDELSYTLRTEAFSGGMFAMTLGRFQFSDLTGRVYHDPLDGAQIIMTDDRLSVSLTSGYTGLLFDHDNTVLASVADALDRTDSNPFGPPRAVAEVLGRYRAPGLGLTFNVALLAQFDFHDPSELAAAGDTTPATGGAVSTQYQSVELAGAFADSFTYSLGATINMGQMLYFTGSRYTAAPIRALYSSGSLQFAPPLAVEPVVALETLYASGDEDALSTLEGNTAGAATAFVPVSNRSLGFVLDPFLSNLVRIRLRGALLPFGTVADANLAEALLISASGTAYLQPTSGASPFDEVSVGYTGIYLGSEAGIRIEVIPAPFINLDLEGALFVPGTAAFGSQDLRYRAVATLRIAY